MATERHLLTEIDTELLIAVCDVCNTLVKIVATGSFKPDGSKRWRCKTSHRSASYRKNFPWKQHKKLYCEECGFIALVTAQLHVDHIDGSKLNNDVGNLKTLCANCHAYKTVMNQDWMSNKFSQSSAI